MDEIRLDDEPPLEPPVRLPFGGESPGSALQRNTVEAGLGNGQEDTTRWSPPVLRRRVLSAERSSPHPGRQRRDATGNEGRSFSGSICSTRISTSRPSYGCWDFGNHWINCGGNGAVPGEWRCLAGIGRPEFHAETSSRIGSSPTRLATLVAVSAGADRILLLNAAVFEFAPSSLHFSLEFEAEMQLVQEVALVLPDEHSFVALLAGERGSQLLAVDNQDDAKQEQPTSALFDFQPQWEGAGQRDDGDDRRQHDGRDEPQPEIPAAGAAGHLASEDGRQQGARRPIA